MDFRILHEINASLAQVEAAVLDPSLLRRLPAFTSMVAEAHERARHDHGDRVEREAVYVAAFVPAPLIAMIPPAWATWIEHTEWDRRAHTAVFRIEPQLPLALRRRITCHGRYALRPLSEACTSREITVVLEIAASGVGRHAEAILARIITQQFAGEAALLGVLAQRPASLPRS